MERPLLLVDVDGVLNPWGFEERPAGFEAHRLFADDADPVLVAALHGEWLRELTTSFDLAWASGWGTDANRLLAPMLGLPELPVVPLPEIPFPPQAKVPAVAAFVGDRAVAWLDDMMVPEAHDWAEARTAPTLLLDVDHTTGLTRGHVERLRNWSQSLRS